MTRYVNEDEENERFPVKLLREVLVSQFVQFSRHRVPDADENYVDHGRQDVLVLENKYTSVYVIKDTMHFCLFIYVLIY